MTEKASDSRADAQKSGIRKAASRIADTLGLIPSPASIPDTATYFYIKEVKKWMECPVCGGRLQFDKEEKNWSCEECSFVLPEDDFLNGYVFWFCDQCDEFLNVQDGFDPKCNVWKCTVCGHANDITDENLRGICAECTELLDDPNATLCKDCEIERLEKMAAALDEASAALESLKKQIALQH